MLTGSIRSKIEAIWDAFWSGGISNPLEENKSARLKKPMERRIFPEGADPRGRPYDDLRWSRFKHFEAKEMFTVVSEHVFPFLRTLGGDGSTYAHHMKDARFTIPTPVLLAKVVDMLEQVPMEDRDTKGDLYEYMLGKIASAGQNGQFRTPRHIIQLMVELTAPTPRDVICVRPAAPPASSSPPANTSATATPRSSVTPGSKNTSMRTPSTASTSTTPCSASAA